MRSGLNKARVYGRRMLTVFMAAACLCTAGCANPNEPAVLPDAEQIQSEGGLFDISEPHDGNQTQGETVDGAINTEEPADTESAQGETGDSTFQPEELPDAGYTEVEYEKYIPIPLEEIATPEPVVSYPGVNISYAHEITAYATDSSIYMRAEPDASTDDDNIVKKVQDAWGAEFYLRGITGDWYYARYTEDGVDYIGYVRKQDIHEGDIAPTPTPESAKKPEKDNKDNKKDDKKEDKKEDGKEDKKEDGKTEPTPTPGAKKIGKTPYSGKYSKVSLKYENSSEGIKFETTTLDGDAVSDSLLSRNAITMVNIWTQT